MEQFIMFGLWAACVAGCGYLAKEKNRSTGGWVALGFVFGIFALILLAFLPALPKALVRPTQEG